MTHRYAALKGMYLSPSTAGANDLASEAILPCLRDALTCEPACKKRHMQEVGRDCTGR